MEDNVVDHVYYICNQNTLSVVPDLTHKSFCKYIIAKYCNKVDDSYWKNKTQEEILVDFLYKFENKEIVYLGEL